MESATHQLPTLGYFHKVVCDSLGLWHSDNEDVIFDVTATEKERRAALRQAFEAIKKEDGRYGSRDELMTVTAQLAPQGSQKVKKSKTIQAYVNHLSKTDFESLDESIELGQYIKVLLTERYSTWGVAELAIGFYDSALAHYREFVREFACNTQNQTYSYQCFTSQDLRLLTGMLARTQAPDDAWPDATWDAAWPLKEFADAACRITGISLHRLHQYHQFLQEGEPNERAWASDFTSQPINTRSKQVIDRLRRYSRMKWETFYPTLEPLTFHLPKSIDKEAFARHAFAAMIAHNLNVHVADCGPFAPPTGDYLHHVQIEHSHAIPSSVLLDLLCNDYPIAHDTFAQQAPGRYEAFLDGIRTLPGSLSVARNIPNNLEFIYKKLHRDFTHGAWRPGFSNSPNWLKEWQQARDALADGNAQLALPHFKAALDQAKYVAGPLLIPFYIQVCAFCKTQYRLHVERKEEELFERFYESLGSDATHYAGLLGYTPQWQRDPTTLMPRSTLPVKSRLIISEIDALVKVQRSTNSSQVF